MPYDAEKADAKDDQELSDAVMPDRRKGVSLFGVSVEYGLHTLLWLIAEHPKRASSRDLAEMQGVPAAMLAKIMPRLEKAGIVTSSDGITGGYELAKPPEDISVLEVVDAIEGDRRLFDCKEVRRGCVLFGGTPPPWSVDGVCRIHAVMLRAERRMRSELDKTSLADLAQGGRPEEFESLVADWFRDRTSARETARVTALREGRRSPR
ncbi:Rrf2 family transcriptional regulator [Rhizobium sp.]|uniref:RrF2 family transcriptional regulator n=1 Tax=Rhizobium sp. TaxID=391 RepID=UPI0028A7E8FA